MNKVNKSNKKSKKKIICILLILVVVIAVIIFIILKPKNIKNSSISGESSESKVAREKNPENYTEVESLDGIKVPVPTGYIASSVESEKYVNGMNIEHRGTSRELTLSSSGEYAWTKNEDGVWVSGNYNVASSTSTLESEEFTIGENGGHLKVNWSVSAEISDILYLIITNTETGISNRCANISTTVWTAYSSLIYTDIEKELEVGKYKISIEYVKNASSDSGLDAGYVKSVEIINYSEVGEGEAVAVEHQYGGFVIYEGEEEVTESNVETAQKTRNQWVWIPVNDTSRIYSETNGVKKGKNYKFSATGRTIDSYVYEPVILRDDDTEYNFSRNGLMGMTKEKFYQEMKIEFEETIESIEAYGGFYIGRYETGNISGNFPVVQKGNTDISKQTWYEMYGKMEAMAMHESVKSNMIWGCLWDETLQWLVDTGCLRQDELVLSTSWGNYSDSELSYTTTSGTTATTKIGTDTVIPTGSSEYTNVNNIYDMAGNVSEWALDSFSFWEVASSSRYLHGGDCLNYSSNEPASYRGGHAPDYSYRLNGFRAYLYIK